MKVTIDIEHAEKFRNWFDNRGGVLRWENQEIASGAVHEVFTPATTAEGKDGTKCLPNWRYENPVLLTPEDVTVEVATVLLSFRGRFKAHYWGPGAHQSTEKKAERLVAEYAKGHANVSWRFGFDGPGFIQVEIVSSKLESFCPNSPPVAV